MNQLRAQALELIEKALRDELDLGEASQFLSGLDKDADHTVSEAAHVVVHFVTDSDLRASDKSYEANCRADLRRYIEKLRNF